MTSSGLHTSGRKCVHSLGHSSSCDHNKLSRGAVKGWGEEGERERHEGEGRGGEWRGDGRVGKERSEGRGKGEGREGGDPNP